ncbi:MAG: hypothetical protein FJ296_02260 [Planctomycetes bacterium]|nr:hypothetical protein [Planctomycetota bacterium]
MSKPATKPTYVLCVRNRGYAASLEVRKLYRRLEDSRATRLGLLRVVDESGEDYLSPADCFVRLRLGEAALRALRRR